jgi:hypothetical protein
MCHTFTRACVRVQAELALCEPSLPITSVITSPLPNTGLLSDGTDAGADERETGRSDNGDAPFADEDRVDLTAVSHASEKVAAALGQTGCRSPT